VARQAKLMITSSCQAHESTSGSRTQAKAVTGQIPEDGEDLP
jgi:hypothetical protein